jgi:hypothetical protein
LAQSALPDILVSDGRTIWMRGLAFDADNIGGRTARGASPIWSTAGFLDDTGFNRTRWSCMIRRLDATGPPVFDQTNVYALGRSQFSRTGAATQLVAYATAPQGKPSSKSAARSPAWRVSVPMRGQSLLLTDRQLLVAGAPIRGDSKDFWAWYEGRKGGMLQAHSRADGKKLGEYRLASAPVYHGLAAAYGRLYLSQNNGEIVCMGGSK